MGLVAMVSCGGPGEACGDEARCSAGATCVRLLACTAGPCPDTCLEDGGTDRSCGEGASCAAIDDVDPPGRYCLVDPPSVL